MDGAADAELDTFDSEFVNDVFRMAEGTSQSVEFGDDESVAVAARGQCFA